MSVILSFKRTTLLISKKFIVVSGFEPGRNANHSYDWLVIYRCELYRYFFKSWRICLNLLTLNLVFFFISLAKSLRLSFAPLIWDDFSLSFSIFFCNFLILWVWDFPSFEDLLFQVQYLQFVYELHKFLYYIPWFS